MPISNVQNVKSFYDPGDLENKVKVKLITCYKGLVILHPMYKYRVCTKIITDLWSFVCLIGYNGKIELYTIK